MTPTPPPGDSAAVALPAPSALDRLRARGRVREAAALLGPAFVAAIAYVDPGNFATNVQGGARYGYTLLWVILAANLMAMLIQYLSAKVGVTTGRNLPQLCRERFPRPVTWALWAQAEAMAMATDLAEFIGAAIALNLLFGVPLFAAGLITAVVAFGILALQPRGYRRFELTIVALLAVILGGFLYDTLRIGPSADGVVAGLLPSFAGGDSVLLATGIIGADVARGLIPGFKGSESLLLAAGILGATVMPHVIYLHSALMQGRFATRDDGERRRLLRFARIDVILAMGIAGVINMAMLAVVAAAFFRGSPSKVDSIEAAHAGFQSVVSPQAALAFALALLASGLAASSVGTYAGQVVMQGFIARNIPLFLRRLVTMTPALIVLAIGLDPTRALVLSQVVLSFGIPLALVPLILLTRRRDVMGPFVNRGLTTVVSAAVAALIICLNAFLIYQTFVG